MGRPLIDVDEGCVKYTTSQIENIVGELFRRRPRIEIDSLPVNVEFILEDTENVFLGQSLPRLMSRFSVEGCVCRRKRSQDIIVHVDRDIAHGLDDAAYNAVIAEELAHIILHRPLFYAVTSIAHFVEIQQSEQWEMMERDARRFSAALRMPVWHVLNRIEPVYAHMVRENGFGVGDELLMLIRNKLAVMFRVSPQEMFTRMCQWPCSVYDRITMSIASKQLELLPPDASMVHREHQIKFPFADFS